MAKIVESDLQPCGRRRRLEPATGHVPVPERRSVVRRERGIAILRERTAKTQSDQLVPEVSGDRKTADTGRRLRRAVLARPRPLAPDVEEGLVLVEVAPLEAEHLTQPYAQAGGQPNQRRVVVARLRLLRELRGRPE